MGGCTCPVCGQWMGTGVKPVPPKSTKVNDPTIAQLDALTVPAPALPVASREPEEETSTSEPAEPEETIPPQAAPRAESVELREPTPAYRPTYSKPQQKRR